MKQYFYIDSNNQQFGPINEDALMDLMQCGAISRQTLIWTEGLEDWQPYGEAFPESAKETSIPPLGIESSITETEAPVKVMPQEQPKLWSKYRKLFIIGGTMTLITAFSIAGYSVCFTSGDKASSDHKTAPAKKKKPKRAKISKEKAVTKLRELGVISSELDIQGKIGSYAMETACKQGNLKIAELLLAGGINAKQLQIYKVDCLGLAAENGHAEIVKGLLAIPGIDVNHSDTWTPLAHAADNGHAEVARLLLAAPGIDVNMWMPLEKAAAEGHLEIVKLLLNAPGIDVNMGSEVFGSMERDRFHTPLKYAAIGGHTEMVKLLLAAPGIDVNLGSTLAAAARHGHSEIVRLLLGAPGIDVNRDEPLALAAGNGHVEVVRLLLGAPGIDVNRDEPLALAAGNGHVEVVKLLLAAPSIDVNEGGALAEAVEADQKEVVKILLAAPGIDVNKNTPLAVAVAKGCISACLCSAFRPHGNCQAPVGGPSY